MYKLSYLVSYVLKTNSNFAKKNNNFGYILPNSCFKGQLSMPASEYTNNATRDIFQFVRNENTKNEHAGIKRKKI